MQVAASGWHMLRDGTLAVIDAAVSLLRVFEGFIVGMSDRDSSGGSYGRIPSATTPLGSD